LENQCDTPPQFLSLTNETTVETQIGGEVELNCTVKLLYSQQFNWCDSSIQWLKDGNVIGNGSRYKITESFWYNNDASEKFLSSLLSINSTGEQDYGVFTCLVKNATASTTLCRSGSASHVVGVLAALGVILALLLVVVLYVKCRLNLKLWYRDKYGEFEINDGKLYDAYVSYICAADDRKFVNFILKPHLENKYSYKLHLDDSEILPNLEPSAELIMNVSRCRRLIVILSKAYLEQDWCTNNFREGLWRLLELSKRPIFIMFESQYRELSHPAIPLLKEHKKDLTLLLWTSKSMTPLSDFWKELCLVLPRKMMYKCTMGDPQTQRQDDKDPMLTLNPDYLDCRLDPDPEGDLGVRGPIYKGPPPRVSALPSAMPDTSQSTESQLSEAQRLEIDISDLGLRNYAARTDFYCLVTEEDI
uniref:Single Ig and TIR domain containing n=1 Tax=Latimeria chalumnae TaxID=7897 RepID=H3BAK3_LATCH